MYSFTSSEKAFFTPRGSRSALVLQYTIHYECTSGVSLILTTKKKTLSVRINCWRVISFKAHDVFIRSVYKLPNSQRIMTSYNNTKSIDSGK